MKFDKKIIIIILVSIVAALFLEISDGERDIEKSDLKKPGYSGAEKNLDVSIYAGKNRIDTTITIEPEKYTAQETEELFFNVYEHLKKEILNDNASLDEIKTDLNLIEKLEDNPVSIEWFSSNYNLIGYDGKVYNDDLKKDQKEEQHADNVAEPHALEHLGNGDEHQRGASLQRAGIAAGEGEHRGDDHQARHDGDGRVEDFDIAGGAFDRDVLFHVGTERDENAHGDGQGIKHLPHGGDDRHPGEVVKIGHKEVLDALQCTGAGHGIHGDDQRQHHENGHHDLGDALDAVFHAREDDRQRHGRENQKA